MTGHRQTTTNPPRDYSAAEVAALERLLSGAPPSLATPRAEWMTLGDLAAAIGKSIHTVYKWSARGYPHFPKKVVLPRGSVRVRSADFEAWLAELAR